MQTFQIMISGKKTTLQGIPNLTQKIAGEALVNQPRCAWKSCWELYGNWLLEENLHRKLWLLPPVARCPVDVSHKTNPMRNSGSSELLYNYNIHQAVTVTRFILWPFIYWSPSQLWYLKICRSAGVSCGSWLLVVVLSLSLSRLSPWRGFLPRLTWTPPPGVALLHLYSFVFIFHYVVLCSTLPTPGSTSVWFCTSCCHFDGCFRIFCCVCHRFAPSLLISNTWSTDFCVEHLWHA